jgi:ribonuclease P protein component
MLPLAERLKRNHLFTKAYSAKKSVVTPFFTLYVLPRISKTPLNTTDKASKQIQLNSGNSNKTMPFVGFVVSKKVSKSACLRNRMKRRTRESYRLLRTQSLNQWYVMILVIKENVLNASWNDLCRTMETAFDEAERKYGRKLGQIVND